jgi:GNAT superfamily N-acetyltransferase
MPSKMKNSGQMPPKLRLKLANECEDLSKRVKLKSERKEYQFHILHSKHVDEPNFSRMMNLFESLMRDMYENSSWGWNQQEKLDEWKHSRTRIALVVKRPSGEPFDNVIFNELPKDDESDELIAFLCFRFETGADKSECALYVYELHVHPDHQRQGLGYELMRMARCFGTEFKMDKIMLTSFRCNSTALQFYNKLKFSTDKSSPAINESDYTILSSKIK